MSATALPEREFEREPGPIGPWIPAAPLLGLCRERVEEGMLYRRFEAAGVRPRLIALIDRGEQERVSFDVADRIVCCVLGDAGLWHRIPWLADAIEED